MQKTRSRPYESWHGDCERFGNHKYRQYAEYEVDPPRQRGKRQKKKKVVLLYTVVAGWFPMRGWHVWGRYERMRDATKALSAVKNKSWPGENGRFKIEDRR